MTVTAHAQLIINPTFNDASFTAAGYDPTAVHNAFNFAAGQISGLFNDPIHINIIVTAGSTGLGQSSTNLLGTFTYAQIRTALVADQTAHPSADGATSIAITNLPVTDPTGGTAFVLARAQAKALGVIGDDLTNDGTFTFSNTQAYTFDPANRTVAGKFDFIGVAQHEITEIMGRFGILGSNIFGTPNLGVNDLFRFTNTGVRSTNQTDTNVYLSIDNGATHLTIFNGPGGGDLADYSGLTVTDPFNAFTNPGQGHVLSAADITNMDVIGYDLSPTAPEPGTAAFVVVGLIGIGPLVRRRRKRANG